MSPNERKLLSDIINYLVDGTSYDFSVDHYIDNTPDNAQLVKEMDIHQVGEECDIRYSKDGSMILVNLGDLMNYIDFILRRDI